MTMADSDVRGSEDLDAPEPGLRRGGFGSLGSVILLLHLTWAAAIASFPLSDNSFFTHLATGRIILNEGSVPSSDPYTFTARGEPWTVQSWLASVAYAGSERLGGELGLRLLVLVVFLAAAALLWRLSRPARSLLPRVAIIASAMFIATGVWGERPYMIGVVGLALVWLAMEREVPPWVLVPVMWIWGNAHGSFPLAAVLVVTLISGAAIDRRRVGARPLVHRDEKRAAAAVALGTLLVAVNPVGLRLLVFPLVAGRRSDVFGQVLEWQAPAFRSPAELAYLVLLAAVLGLLVGRGTWRLALPTIVFALGSLYAQRNIVMALVVLVAVAARCAPSVGSLTSAERPRLGSIAATAVGVLALLVSAATLLTPADAVDDDYPGLAVAWSAARPMVESSMAAEVSTGNLLEVLDGPAGTVFMDDRFDMIPDDVFDDYLVLSEGRSDWDLVLADHGVGTVVWSRPSPLSSLLEESAEWRIAYSDVGWVVACRRLACGAG